MKEFKNQYPIIGILQFMDIYHEEAIFVTRKQIIFFVFHFSNNKKIIYH